MARKKTAIKLSKLTDTADGRLQSMLAELTGYSLSKADEDGKPEHWGFPRFAASGKGIAPRIRIS